jgi:bifunctional oligoribonuclease and PAP phosphatase NrnA
MDTSQFQTLTNLIEKSQNILILAHNKPDPDALGAMLSTYLVLKDLGKQATVVTNDPMKDNVSFLPAINSLQYTLGGTKDFVISIDTSKNAISKLKYNAEEGRLNIIITPKDGIFTAKDVSFQTGKSQYDLILVFDTGNVEYLGPLYDKNVELFYEVPVVNIDHHTSNTDFGRLNIVVPTAASTTEILYDYFTFLEKKHNRKLMTADVATLLLAGLITDTGSFQHANTSPRALEVAAELLDRGGRQQEIIKQFFKTKKLSTLKLWGEILSKVQVDPIHRMVWSSINSDDLKEADAQPEEAEGIIDDLLNNAPGAEVIFLIKQSKEYISVSMRSTNNSVDVGRFCTENGGGGHVRAAAFKVFGGKPFDEVVLEVVGKVREFQAKRLNIQPEDTQIRSMKDINGRNKSEITEPRPQATQTQSAEQPKANESQARVSSLKGIENIAKPETKPTEKKVTYLDFSSPKANESQARVSSLKETSETPKSQTVEQPKVAAPVEPKPVEPKPLESQVSSLKREENPVKAEISKPIETKPEPVVTVPTEHTFEPEQPKPVQPKPIVQAPKPVAKQPANKPNPSLAANPLTPIAGQPNPGQKRKRKRHHKKKTNGAATGAPAAQPKTEQPK